MVAVFALWIVWLGNLLKQRRFLEDLLSSATEEASMFYGLVIISLYLRALGGTAMFKSSNIKVSHFCNLDSDWNLTSEEWVLMSRANKAGGMLFPYSCRDAYAWAAWAFQQNQLTGKTPEQLRDARCPRIKELHARRPPKFLRSR